MSIIPQLENVTFLVGQLNGHLQAGGSRQHAFFLHIDSERLAAVEEHLGAMVDAIDAELANPPADIEPGGLDLHSA